MMPPAALARDGALVVGVDLPAYLRTAGRPLRARRVAGRWEISKRSADRSSASVATHQYLMPIIAGIGEGGALAPAILAQAPAATIAGAVSLRSDGLRAHPDSPMLGVGRQ